MATIRVPYPGDSVKRRALFERAAAVLERHGQYEGTPDGGSFRGTTPIGNFSGHYRSETGSDILEIELTHKPWLVPVSVFEHEVRKFLARV
jgi:hypothetical protein